MTSSSEGITDPSYPPASDRTSVRFGLISPPCEGKSLRPGAIRIIDWWGERKERLAGALLEEFDRYEHRADARAKWLATVLPSFDPYAALLVVHGDPAPMAVFAVEQGPLEAEQWPSIEVSALEVTARWNDPVAHALRDVRLFE